jgi:hypothetical protein
VELTIIPLIQENYQPPDHDHVKYNSASGKKNKEIELRNQSSPSTTQGQTN